MTFGASLTRISCQSISLALKKHSVRTTTDLEAINNATEFLDSKQHCAALFIDLSKAFDTVDNSILKRRLSTGFSEYALMS